MKAFKRLSLIAAIIPVIWGCDNYEMPPIIPQTGATLSSPANGSSLVLNSQDPEELIPFTVTAADFGMQGTVTYSLEMDLEQFFNGKIRMLNNVLLTQTKNIGRSRT